MTALLLPAEPLPRWIVDDDNRLDQMSDDYTLKTAPVALGMSERTIRRRLGYYRAMQAGRRLKAWQRALAIPYRHRLGYPYRIPAEVIDALRRVDAVA